jgi:hypothetical protein
MMPVGQRCDVCHKDRLIAEEVCATCADDREALVSALTGNLKELQARALALVERIDKGSNYYTELEWLRPLLCMSAAKGDQ